MNKNQETSKYFGQLQIQSQFKNHYASSIIIRPYIIPAKFL